MTLNPIIKRDLEQRGRSLSLPVFPAAVSAVLFAVGLSASYGLTIAMRNSMQASFRGFLDVYVMVVMTEYIILLLAAPLYTAASISGERETGIYDLLLTTSLTPQGIVLGKLASALISVFILTVTCLPAMLVPLMCGGVRIQQTIMLMFMFLPSLFFIMSAGMLLSSLSNSAAKSIAAAYAVLFMLTAGLILMPALISTFMPAGENVFAYAALLDPLLPVAAELGRQLGEKNTTEMIFAGLGLKASASFCLHAGKLGMLLQSALGAVCLMLSFAEAVPGRRRAAGKNR